MRKVAFFTAAVLLLSVVCGCFPVSAGQETGTPYTNLTWESVSFAGNDFVIRDDCLYTGQTSNTVFARSDRYVDGSESFIMEYDVTLVNVVDDEFVRGQGWLYCTFSLGMPGAGDGDYTDGVKNSLCENGLTVYPFTRGGVYVLSGRESELPDAYREKTGSFNLRIEYAALFEEIIYYLDGVELDRDYFSAGKHTGYIGLETAWTEMKVTKAVYTAYPDGLPSEQIIYQTDAPTDAPAEPVTEPVTDAPADTVADTFADTDAPTDAEPVTNAVSSPDTDGTAGDKTPSDTRAVSETVAPAPADDESATANDPEPAATDGADRTGNDYLWVIIAAVAVVAVAAAVIIVIGRKKRANR